MAADAGLSVRRSSLETRRGRAWISLVAAAVSAAILAGSSLGATATTGPGSRLEIYFIITQSKVDFAVYALSDYAGNSELYLEPAQGVVRGDVALFTVVNRTADPLAFSLLGKKIPNVKPGGRAHFTADLLTRGSFPYYASSGGKTRAFAGDLVVY